MTKDKLQTAEAVLSLGLVVVRELHKNGMLTVFLNENGEVEMCPVEEIYLDAVSQETALDNLIDRGYDEQQMMAYLKGRKARGKLRG